MHILWRRSQFGRPPHNPAILCGQPPTSARCCSRPQPRSVSCSISTGDGGTDRNTRGTRLASTTDGRTDSLTSRESWTPSVQWRSIAVHCDLSQLEATQQIHQAASTTRRTIQQSGAVATRGAQFETWPGHRQNCLTFIFVALNFFWHKDETLRRLGYECLYPKLSKFVTTTSAVQVAMLITGCSALNLIKLYRGRCKDEMSSGTGYDAVQTGVAI